MVGEHDEVLDVLSGAASLAHVAHGGVQSSQRRRLSVVVGPENSLSNGVTTTGGRPQRPHSRHSPRLHSLISFHPFHRDGAQDRFGAPYLPTRFNSSPYPSWAPFSSPSSASSSSVFPSWRSVPFDTAEVLVVEADLRGTTLNFGQRVYPPCVFLPPELHPWFWRPSGGPWKPDGVWRLLTPIIPPGSPEQEMTGQRP